MTTVLSDEVETVLNRLYSAEEANDPAALRRLAAEPGVAEASPEVFAELAQHVSMAVPRETGRLLYLLARAAKAGGVVEFGTSFGISTLHLASAVRDNGGGWVVGTELSEHKVRVAEDNLAEAGLDEWVELRAGNALHTLEALPGPVDLLLLDGGPRQCLAVLRLLEPRLRPGALVLADGLPPAAESVFGPAPLDELYRYLREPGNGYVSVGLPLGDGLEIALRLG